MPNIRTLSKSFSGGELSPEMYGRIDDLKYQNGLALCRNFIVKPQGPVENRPGFQFVRAVKNSLKKVRLIPFTYSTTQTMVLEMGEYYFRFHTMGATLLCGTATAWAGATVYAVGDLVSSGGANYYCKVAHTSETFSTDLAAGKWYAEPDTGEYEIPSPYAEADLFDIHYVQSADIITLVHTSYAPRELRRLGSTDWVLSVIDFTPDIAAPATVAAVASGHTLAKYTYNYVVTAIAADGVSESSPSSAASARGNVYETGGIVTISWSTVAAAKLYKVYKKQGGIFGYIGSTATLSLIDDNIAPDLSQTPPTYEEVFRANGISSVPVTAGGSNYATSYSGGVITAVAVTAGGSGYPDSPSVNIADATGSGAVLTAVASEGVIVYVTVVNGGSGYSNPVIAISGGGGAVLSVSLTARYIPDVTLAVTDSTGSGAVLTPVIVGGVIQSVIVSQPGTGYTAPSVSVSQASGGSGATFGTPTLTGENFPGAVSYFEQRRAFAGTIAAPQNIWMTRSGTESNMSYSLPIRDDDRIAFRVAAREANTIRHIVPLSQLVLLTSAAEWRVTSINSDAITPESFSVRPQSYIGANNTQPLIVNANLIYAASRGGHVMECSYSWQGNGYVSGDLSLRSAHLFDSYDISDMARSKAPLPLLWFISTSGKLLGLTYIPEQHVGAWHQHDTYGGIFESCAVVAEGNEDSLYVVVKRLVNGSYVRYIERLASRAFVDSADAFFVDSGLSYDGNNNDATITMTVSGGTLWNSTELLTITASAPTFAYPGTTDVGDAIVFTVDDAKYTLTIESVTSTTVARARVDNALPAGLRGTATAVWAFARSTMSGLTHLEGETVSILADGAVHPAKVVSSGVVTLEAPAVIVHVGLPIEADLRTLPAAMQIDSAFGQGRTKNVNKVAVRVYRSSGLFVGPDEDHLRENKQRTTEPYGAPPELKSEEIPVTITPTWADSGQVFIRQSNPLPLTVAAIIFEIAVGG